MGEASQSGGFAKSAGNELDVLFELLSHPYRRFIPQCLIDANGPQTVDEVAAALSAWQADLPVADQSATGIDAIESALHHRHLPKMAAAGVIEFDPTRGTVAPGTRITAVTSYLDKIDGSTAPVGRDRSTS